MLCGVGWSYIRHGHPFNWCTAIWTDRSGLGYGPTATLAKHNGTTCLPLVKARGGAGGIRTELCSNPSSRGIGVDFPLVETGFNSSFCADVINHNDLSSGYKLPSLPC